jgi:hypothetical protein
MDDEDRVLMWDKLGLLRSTQKTRVKNGSYIPRGPFAVVLNFVSSAVSSHWN